MSNDKQTVQQPLYGLNNAYKIKSITADYGARAADCVILADCTAGNVNVNLLPAKIKGLMLFIKRTSASANNVVINRAGTDTIEGATSITLSAQYQSRTIISDGSGKWHILATT